MQRRITAFQDPMKKFGSFLGGLKGCPLITPGAYSEPNQDWQQKVNEYCKANRGIYVFHADGKPMSVGRTDSMLNRIKGHRSMTNNGLPRKSATFARILAKEAFNQTQDVEEDLFSLQLTNSFKALEDCKREEFLRPAIRKVQEMSIKVVEVTHPHDQTVFEVFVHEMLGTPYNSFRNH